MATWRLELSAATAPPPGRRQRTVVLNAWRDRHHPLAGGSELVVDLIGNGLQGRGHRVLLRAGEAAPRSDGMTTVSGGGRYSQFLSAPLHRAAFSDADVVVDVNNGLPFLSSLWHDRASVCVVHHLHLEQWEMYFPRPVAGIGRRIEALGIEWAYRRGLYATISQSSAEALERLGVPADRIRELRMPVKASLQACAPTRPSATPRFVSVGRLVANKRYDLLLDMWARVEARTGGELIIIGDGPERARLEARAVPGVRFVGRVDDPTCARLLSSAWLLVHAAAHEGWGLVVTEAAWFGTPSLAFDVPGVRDAVRRDGCGWLAHDADDFVHRWIALARNRALLESRGADAQASVHQSGQVDQLVDDMEDVIEEAIALQGRMLARHGWASLRTVQASPLPSVPSDRALGPFTGVSNCGVAPATSFVIPAFNEARRLPVLLAALHERVGDDAEIIVVDDGSADGTAEVARSLLGGGPNTAVISHRTNLGKGAAIRTGVAAARGERTVFMDADLATDLSALETVDAALDGSPIAIGVRRCDDARVRNGEPHRRAMAIVFNSIVRRCTDVEFLDTQCGFKGFHTDVAKLLFHLGRCDGFAFDVEILWLAAELGLDVAEFAVDWSAVEGSKVDMFRDPARMAWDVAKLRRAHAGDRTVRAVVVDHREVEPQVLGKEVARIVRSCDSIISTDRGVAVPLPGITAHGHRRVAQRIAGHLDDSEVRCGSLPAASMVAHLSRWTERPPPQPLGDGSGFVPTRRLRLRSQPAR